MKNKSTFRKGWVGISLTLVLITLLVVPLPFAPPNDTRMILDHTHEVYIAPPCFNEAEATNYLTETTWDKVQEKDYVSNSDCTAKLMEPVKYSLLKRIGEKLGLMASDWSW